MAAKHTIAVSKFKATCLEILKRVKRTGQPVVVTRFGEPLAEVVPPAPPQPSAGWLGRLRDTARITGDLVPPAVPAKEWHALRS